MWTIKLHLMLVPGFCAADAIIIVGVVVFAGEHGRGHIRTIRTKKGQQGVQLINIATKCSHIYII